MSTLQGMPSGAALGCSPRVQPSGSALGMPPGAQPSGCRAVANAIVGHSG